MHEGFRELERIEQVFSAYREDSELSSVNRNAGREAVTASEEFFHVTQRALRRSRETRGAVDITVGPLLSVWGIRQNKPRPPSEADLVRAKRLVGSERVILDRQAKSIRFRHAGMELDFGGVAKGYAAEKIAGQLEKLGVPSALVNLGRSSLCASRVRQGWVEAASSTEPCERLDRWPVAIAHPDGRGAPPLYCFLEAGNALSTSGTAEGKFEIAGKQFSHIINPITGMPISGASSATVVSRDGILAEVASKELLLMDATLRPAWHKDRSLALWAHFAVAKSGELIENTSSESWIHTDATKFG